MALAGCTGVFVGFESLAGREPRRRAQEDARAPPTTRAACALLHDHGIQVNGSFVLGFDHDRKDVFARTAAVDRGEPAGVRDVPHPDALSRHAAVPADGGRGPAAAPRLDALRHGARRLPAAAHDARASWTQGYALVLPAAVLARARSGGAGRTTGAPCRLPGDVVPLQALEPVLAPVDPAPADRAVWRPLVEITRRRHLRFRRRLATRSDAATAGQVVSAGV